MIDAAIPRDSAHCIWADAVKAAYPEASRIAVDVQVIRFSDANKGLRYTYLTPRTAQISLVQFDQGIRPEAHSVQLRRGHVTKMQETGGKDALKKGASPAKAGQRAAALQKANTLNKATLRLGKGSRIPERVGGKPPPLAVGRRRAFGLRGIRP